MNSFPYDRFSKKTRFETEAQGTCSSEMAYWNGLFLLRTIIINFSGTLMGFCRLCSVPDKQLWLEPREPSVLRSASHHSRQFPFHHLLGVFEDPMKEIVFSSLGVVQHIAQRRRRGGPRGLRGDKTFIFVKKFLLNAVNSMAENLGFQNNRGGCRPHKFHATCSDTLVLNFRERKQ